MLSESQTVSRGFAVGDDPSSFDDALPPSIPDVKPSRGQEEDDLIKHQSLGSERRKPKSHGSSSRSNSGHHHSSTHHHHHSSASSSKHRKSSSQASETSSPRRSSHSSRRSSSSRTPENSSKRKLRLADGDGSAIHSRSLLSSPGTTSISSSHSRSNRSSASSSRYSKTPDSKKQHSKRKLRLSDAVDESNIHLPSLENTTATSNSRAISEEMTPTLEATAAPDMAGEIEAARQQGRQEGRNESNTVFVATPAPKDNAAKKYVCIALFIVLIAVAITIWQLLSGKSAIPQVPSEDGQTTFDPPSEEDCLAISNGSSIEGQDTMPVKTIGVEIDFAVATEVDLALLRAELEAKIQRDVLPKLAGCKTKGYMTVENNNIVANAILNTILVDEPLPCEEGGSEDLCSTVDLELELILHEDESGEALLNLVTKVFEDEGLLELLSLASPVKETIVKDVFVILPTSSPPTSNPSIRDDNTPDDETCSAIANGDSVQGQEDMAVQEYDILMDVMLDSEVELSPVTIELEQKLQQLLMPMLAGCTIEEGRRRRLFENHQWIVNALVDVEAMTDGECLPESESPCHRYVAHLFIYIIRIVASADFSDSILAEFREAPLIQRLGLLPPFKRIAIVSELEEEETPTASPTAHPSTFPPTEMPSANPTRAPVTYPTTDDPTRSPTAAPSVKPTTAPVTYPTTEAPTATPTKLPTRVPTKRPTPIPTPQPVVGPTLPPTPFPTRQPSTSPSSAPTFSPTAQPSATPSRGPTPKPSESPSTEPSLAISSEPSVYPTFGPTPSPTSGPTPSPSTSPTFGPSSIPSSQPTARACFMTNTGLVRTARDWFSSYYRPGIESQFGPIGDWCFSAGVTSMEELFQWRSDFREDIGRWNVSLITNMKSMFQGATYFNQDIGSWDVSSVTTMEYMFDGAHDFNQNITGWDVSSVTNMRGMFQNAYSFNQNIGSWDVSLVQNMAYMFLGAYDFNQPIGGWHVTSVADMREMFRMATSFNSDIGDWKVYNVANTNSMFYSAVSFNQDISDWKLSSDGDMRFMFEGALSFNQNLCAWRLHVWLSDYYHMNSRAFGNTNCPTEVDPENGIGPFCYVCA